MVLGSTLGAVSCPDLGRFEMLVLDCTGIDWNAPVHVHIEGALERGGPRRPVPVIDLDHTFGASTDNIFLHLSPPASAVPPPAPAEICAEACD